ncbi:MAG: RrF2 family transcriptional regulator [Anaeroplasma sp.]
MISTKGRYALRVMIDIANNSEGNYISLKDISLRQGISLKYLEQVIQLLLRNGLLQSLRGNNGGYRLAKDANEITVYEVLKAAEGCLAPVACLADCASQCVREDKCSTVEFWKGFDKVITEYLNSRTIGSFVSNKLDEYSI